MIIEWLVLTVVIEDGRLILKILTPYTTRTIDNLVLYSELASLISTEYVELIRDLSNVYSLLVMLRLFIYPNSLIKTLHLFGDIDSTEAIAPNS